mmetsp:Transcript_81762/g.179680  ORF Transcript_81762/g.179680 Transcript_81762/m.179680 type:complete len:93 (-) Transcript_81762:38-316(-)
MEGWIEALECALVNIPLHRAHPHARGRLPTARETEPRHQPPLLLMGGGGSAPWFADCTKTEEEEQTTTTKKVERSGSGNGMGNVVQCIHCRW